MSSAIFPTSRPIPAPPSWRGRRKPRLCRAVSSSCTIGCSTIRRRAKSSCSRMSAPSASIWSASRTISTATRCAAAWKKTGSMRWRTASPERPPSSSMACATTAPGTSIRTERGRDVPDSLYVVGADGNQTYPFRVCLHDGKIELKPRPDYLPMRLFGGKALVGTDDGAYYDFAEDWIRLVQQRRPRYVAEPTWLTEPLDGRDPDCVWHRLMLDACIPPETKVEVWTRAANDKNSLA